MKQPLPTYCGLCGEPILRRRLTDGRWVRVDRERVMSADQPAGTKLVTPEGRIIEVKNHREGFGSMLYQPHLQTCCSVEAAEKRARKRAA